MEKNNSLKQDILRALSYVLVAAIASMLTLFLAPSGENQKLAQIRWLIDTYRRPDGRFMLTMGNGATEDWKVNCLDALFDETLTYGKN